MVTENNKSVGSDPESWPVFQLQAISKVIDCKHRTPKYVENGVPLISPGTIKWGPLDLDSPQKRVTIEEYESLMDHCTVDLGDLVLSRNQSVGIASYVTSEKPFVIGQDTVLIKPVKIDATFLFYSLQSTYIQDTIRRIGGGSTFSRINLGEIRKLKLQSPPLPEQKKIAKILTTWDEAIVTTEQLLANSQQQKKALMQQLLTGKKRFPGFEVEWSSRKLGNIAKIAKGSQLNRATLSKIGTYPVINGGITHSGYTEKYNTDAETITISEGGNSCGFVNYLAQPFWSGGHCYTLKQVEVSKPFLFQTLKLAERRIMRLRVGSGLPNIQKKDLESLTITIPPDEEQERIAKTLISADVEIATLQQKLERLKLEKKALMQQLLTGKRRVKI